VRGGLDVFARRLFAAAVVLVVAGGVVLVVGGAGGTAGVIGGVLLAIAAVLGVSLAFYLVGRSEDRDRRHGRA
jgi:F0F1-type ATP synthase assembly protein I